MIHFAQGAASIQPTCDEFIPPTDAVVFDTCAEADPERIAASMITLNGNIAVFEVMKGRRSTSIQGVNTSEMIIQPARSTTVVLIESNAYPT